MKIIDRIAYSVIWKNETLTPWNITFIPNKKTTFEKTFFI